MIQITDTPVFIMTVPELDFRQSAGNMSSIISKRDHCALQARILGKIIAIVKNSKNLQGKHDTAIQASSKGVSPSTPDKPPTFAPDFEAAKAADQSNIVYVYLGAGSTRVQMYTPAAKAY